jgi:hypothetical protein
MTEPGVDPCRLRLERDLASSRFDGGVDAGYWRVIEVDWPYVTVAITAGDGNELGMRLLVDGYPAAAPAGRPWDLAGNVALPASRLPMGGSSDLVFRSAWSAQNDNAPYMACERTALATHPAGWASELPDRKWTAARTIDFYLAQVHHELRSVVLVQQGT